MNKKGFTLVEIIICIALISIIGVSSTIIVIKTKNKNNNVNILNGTKMSAKLSNITNKILQAANVYIAVEKDGNGNTYETGIKNGGKGLYIKVQTLVDNGYLDKSVLDNLKKETDKSTSELQLLAVDAVNKKDDKLCNNSNAIEYTVSWSNDNDKPIYLCPYDTIKYEEDIPKEITGDLGKKLFNKYKYSTEIPKFVNKSPSSLDENIPYKQRILNYSNKNIGTYKPDYCNGNYIREEFTTYNNPAFFSDNYIFKISDDKKYGYYQLNNYEKNYMSDAILKGKKYMCLKETNMKDGTCKVMYRIDSYSSIKGGFSKSSSHSTCSCQKTCGLHEEIRAGAIYTFVENYGKGDSGLYRYVDNDGYTYYFRGKIDNNYIKLKSKNNKYSELFQIVRFNGDGTIRLMSTEPVKENDEVKKVQFYGMDYYKYVQNYTIKEEGINDYTKRTYYGLNDIYKEYIFNEENGNFRGKSLTKGYANKNIKTSFNNGYKYYVESNNLYEITEIKSVYQKKGDSQYTIEYKAKKYSSENKSHFINSGTKQILENWYDNMKEYKEFILLGKFCNDISLSNSYDNNVRNAYLRINSDVGNVGKTTEPDVQPSFLCYQAEDKRKGGILNEYVGLITADELVFSGIVPSLSNVGFVHIGSWGSSNFYSLKKDNIPPKIDNQETFLYRNNDYVTLTGFPFYNNGFYQQSVRKQLYGQYLIPHINQNGDNNTKTDWFSLYPVINISSNIKIEKGDGSKNNPYILYID